MHHSKVLWHLRGTWQRPPEISGYMVRKTGPAWKQCMALQTMERKETEVAMHLGLLVEQQWDTVSRRENTSRWTITGTMRCATRCFGCLNGVGH